jgi:hypothetical protein
MSKEQCAGNILVWPCIDNTVTRRLVQALTSNRILVLLGFRGRNNSATRLIVTVAYWQSVGPEKYSEMNSISESDF